jgi:NAD(P)-dependent dehydrogenase (short-subunit alcohol dehydrogenase family)
VTETLAVELSNTGVTVNAVAPGAMRTEMTMQIIRAGPDKAGTREVAAVQRLVDDELPGLKAADLCVFLASSQAERISGKFIAALWDSWPHFPGSAETIRSSDVFTLRRVLPQDRGLKLGGQE